MTGVVLISDQKKQLKLLAVAVEPRLRRRAPVLLLYESGSPTRQAAGAALPPSELPAGSRSEEPAFRPAEPVPPSPLKPGVRKQPGILPDDSLAEAGRKTLLHHFQQMESHEAGTILGEDIEDLHDMRVATRRMRAAFDLFRQSFSRQGLKRFRLGLRDTGRALGKVRDLDVLIEKAEHDLAVLPGETRQGLQPLLKRWQQERELARVEMTGYLKSKEYARFKQKFSTFLNTPVPPTLPAAGTPPVPDRVRDVVPLLIYKQFAAVRAYESVLDQASFEQLHALRIEFKRLRYAIEFFREVLGEEARQVIDRIKAMQDHLGDLNDARLACELLGQYLQSWEELQAGLSLNQRPDPQPVLAYLAAKHAERHHLMITFPDAWERFKQPELGRLLALALGVL